MRKLTTLAAAAALCLLAVSCGSKKDEPLKISIFCDHIGTIARQEGISFAEAATLVKEMGYTGADIRVFQRPSELKSLDSLGFEHACAITEIDYSKEDQTGLEDKTLEFMAEQGFDRLLLVTGLMPDDAPKAARDAARERIAAFADRVTAQGYEIMVEDYDNRRSLCYNAERIDSIFTLTANLGLVFDSGNFLFAGQDALECLGHFRDRVGHVHLKDRASSEDMTCTPVGNGCIPIDEVIGRLVSTGYDGWFTVEQYGSRNMLQDSETSFQNVQALLQR